jgi:hypothetical protein
MSAPAVKAIPKAAVPSKTQKSDTKSAPVVKKVEDAAPRSSRSMSKSPVKDSKDTGKSSSAKPDLKVVGVSITAPPKKRDVKADAK